MELIKHPMVAVGNRAPKFKCYGGGVIHCEIVFFFFFPFPTPTSGKMKPYPLYLGQDINPGTVSVTVYDPLKYLNFGNRQEPLPLVESPPFHTWSGNAGRQGFRHGSRFWYRVFFLIRNGQKK